MFDEEEVKDGKSSQNYKRSFLHSKWAEKLRWFIRTPKRSNLVAIVGYTMLYATIFNTVAYFFYGKDHPRNRHNWRKMERKGVLSKELIEKKKAVDAYFYDVFSQVHLWNWESDKNSTVFSFHRTNFD